jgi:hypothetical protein
MPIEAQPKARSRSLRNLEEQNLQQCTTHVRASATSYRIIRLILVLVVVAGWTYQSAIRPRADEKPNSTTPVSKNRAGGSAVAPGVGRGKTRGVTLKREPCLCYTAE